jgi:hypothetical protein
MTSRLSRLAPLSGNSHPKGAALDDIALALKPFHGSKAFPWLLLIALALPIGNGGCTQRSQSSPLPLTPQRLVAVEGATLDRFSTEKGNVIYLQTLDLHKIQIDQLTGNVDRSRQAQGFYYPNPAKDSSPFFQRLTVAQVRKDYQQRHRLGIFSIINASFFEDYQRSTRLSFPLKLNGKLITAGSSPYGPISKPADPYYRKVELQALIWDNTKATIAPYNPANGYPLNRAKVQNALVSYRYKDHPAYALAGDPANRYHVLGILNPEDAGKTNRLLIATSDRATLEGAANVLRQQGVKGDLMTIDGGISTYLWSDRAGDLILPQVADGEKVPALPHYLGIRSKKNL